VYGTLFRAQSSTLQKYPIKLTRTRDVVPRHTKLRFRNPVLEKEDICFCFRDGFVKQDVSPAPNETDQRQPRLGKSLAIGIVHRGTLEQTTLLRPGGRTTSKSIHPRHHHRLHRRHSRRHIKMQIKSFARRTPYVARFVGSYSIIASVRTLILP
jgi:hypothetical protein